MEEKEMLMFKRLAAISVPAFIVIIATLALLDIRGVFKPPRLLPILNTLFISAMSFAVAYMSARSYLTAGVTSERVSKRGKLKVILAYLGVLVLTALVTIASLQGAIPPFFIQGVGPALFRQVVLGTAVALFAISSFLFMGLYFQSKQGFLYWYSLGLALIAVGLSAVFLQKAVGSPIGWAGRSAQYLGGIYFLVGVLTAIRGAHTKGMPLEKAVADFFRVSKEYHRLPVETIGVLIFIITISSVIAWYINRHAVAEPLPFPKQRIVVGCTDNFPPFDLRDEKGNHIGYARDISMAVAKELGAAIEYRTSSRWVEVVEWLKNGEVDLIHLIAYSTERDEYFDFTIPHTLVPEVIFVRSERLDIHGLDDLEGKHIGAVRRHITHEKLLKYEGLNIMIFETPREGVEALLDGKVDAFAYPEFVFEYLVQQMGREDEIKIVGEPLGHLRYGMAVREGDHVLLSYLDRAIKRIEASGKRDEIARRWFGRKVFLGLTREEVLSLIGWAVFGLLVTSLGGLAYISVRYKLRKAEAVVRHNLIFQHMDDSVILTSLDGKITDWNPGAERMFGHSREEILGRRLDFLLAPEGSTELFETIIREVQGDGIWSGEIRAVRKDGSQVVCSVRATALRNEKGDIIAYVSIIRDMTEQKRAEEELQERRDENTKLAVIAEERGELQRWINTFDTFVGKFDPNGVMIFCNEAPTKAGGLTKDDAFGKYFPDTKWWLHSEIERTRIVECFQRAKAGLSSRIETNFRSADGTPVPIIFNCQPVMDDDGKVNYITAEGKIIIEEMKLRNALQEEKESLEKRVKERTSELVAVNEKLKKEIAERKRTEEALRKSREDYRALAGKLLTAQEEEHRRLAREMHDDLTQQLAVLAIETGKLEQQLQTSPGPICNKLREVREKLVKLSADVHAVSRQLHPSILDDLGLVAAIESESTHFARKEGIAVNYKPKGVPPKVPKDVALCIYRIIQEGLRNIVKHAQASEANISLIGKGDRIHLSIKDNGIGFDPTQVKKKGGLGLASMAERVHLIQGAFSIQSKPGQGTAIKVRAPLSGA